MTTKTYTVHRPMQDGARSYQPGDTRELTETDAADLVASGALSLEGEEPASREPAVRHTFGEEPTGYTGYSSASEPSVTLTPDAKAAERKSARAKPHG